MVLVVGIPSRNEASTIANVTATVDEGLSQLFPGATSYIINADNASDDGTSQVFSNVPTQATKIALTTSGSGGKGTNVFAILQAAADLDADAVCLIDGDLRSVQPNWLRKLMTTALSHEGPALVTPEYTRSRYEANTTNQLVVPYLRAAFGIDIRQPIGGAVAMNRNLIKHALTWSRCESTDLYGVDVWLTINTAIRGFRLDGVYVGRAVHNPTFPKIFKLGQQVLDELFRLMMEHRPATPQPIPSITHHELRVDTEVQPLPDRVVAPIAKRASDYIVDNWDELVFTFPSLLTLRSPKAGELPAITSPLWCEILTEAYAQLTIHSFRRIRDHIVGLFPARVVTYWQEIEGMSAFEVDVYLENQALSVATLFASRPLPQNCIDLSSTPELMSGHWTETRSSV
jgi:glucosylglycerate synthase